MSKKIYAGSDHAGFALRRRLVEHLRARGHAVEDLGAETDASCDYPDYAAAVARAVAGEAGAVGLLVCGTGLGVCIAANKVHGIRAVDAWNVEVARISRAHNDANVLCLGARTTPEGDALAIAEAWLAAPFEGGRHAIRVGKIAALEAGEDHADGVGQQKQPER
ncbi:MAG TPA: ribose 5-phosphate isomerase B [Polyangia bacterium]|nr:ribose 5-phosphate isomerase B [Polyangia bacterium]